MEQAIMRRGAPEAAPFIEIPWEEECVVLYDGDEIETLLPGRAHTLRRAQPCTAMTFRREAAYDGVAGTGGIELPGGAISGWASFGCRLLSARRFVRLHADELREGAAAEAILTRMVRESLADGFRAAGAGPAGTQAALRAAAWRECHGHARDALLRSGWLLTSFKLERLARSGGENACTRIR